MLLFVDVLGMQGEIQLMGAKVITTILVMIWNYFSKRKVLTYKKKKPESEESGPSATECNQ